MTKLLGTKPNQAPTNNDLGDLAYQDMDKLPTINVADDGFIVTEDGDVGIGTASPSSTLHVASTSPSFVLEDTDADADFLRTDFRLSGGDLQIQTRTSTHTFVSNDYLMNKDASGATSHAWRIAGAGALYLDGTGLGIDTTSPTHVLDVNSDSIRVRTAKTPASASDTGTQGQIAWDADYIYICVATDTWKRAAISTW